MWKSPAPVSRGRRGIAHNDRPFSAPTAWQLRRGFVPVLSTGLRCRNHAGPVGVLPVMPRQRAPQEWPVPDERLQPGVAPDVAESETLVGAGGPPPSGVRRWYDDRLAAGLIALLVLVLLAAGAVYYLHHRHNKSATQPTTVVVTTVAKAKTPQAKAMPLLV